MSRAGHPILSKYRLTRAMLETALSFLSNPKGSSAPMTTWDTWQVGERYQLGRILILSTVSFDWVLSGFGAGPGCTKIDDWFALKPRSAGEADCGQLRLSMVYEPTA